MSENETTSDQDDVSFIRTDDMVCLQCSETGERVCLAAEGFGNRHCFLESIANKNYPPEMPSCVFVIEQALSVRALQEMVTAESSDTIGANKQAASGAQVGGSGGGGGESGEGGEDNSEASAGADAPQMSAVQLTSKGAGDSSGLGGGNRTLLYGHAVLLRHLHSGMYLATLSICSSSDKLAFDVGLKDTKEIGESCWWTVHPGSKQRSEGEKVRVGDDLILVSVATERYLHYTTSDQPTSPPPMASASAAAVMSSSSKQAIVNASFHSTHWSIAPFGTGLSRMKNVGYVFGGQVLRLLHGGDECLTISAQQATQSEGTAAQNLLAIQTSPTSRSGQQQQSSAQTLQTMNENLRNSVSAKHQIDVIYEGGAVMNQARSLWRVDLIRTRWSGGFVQCSNALRLRHITTGKYLGTNEQNQLCLLPKIDATVERTAFCLRLTKDDSKGSKGDGGDDKDEEVIGSPMIKYGDTSFFIQHIDTQMWLSYRSYETKKRGIGRVEEKQAILSAEGKMDDCLEFSRSQEEEAKTARVIRKCDALFSKFIKILDHVQQVALLEKESNLEAYTSSLHDQTEYDGRPLHKKRPSVANTAIAAAALSSLAPLLAATSSSRSDGGLRQDQEQSDQHSPPTSAGRGLSRLEISMQPSSLFPYQSQIEMSKCLEDLIDYFAPPEEGCDHEQEQNRLRALRNRQDLFQEEGILNLILDAIDKINLISGQGLLVLLLGEESSSTWEAITGYLYQLLAAIIKDNHTNCAQFAQSHRLNWLFSRLSSQQASEGTGMLDVLHCVLVDSPEALNMLKESHIKVLISLLEKHGRDPKVLNVLCSLCVSNGVAIRSSQNTITNNLLPGRNLLLQTRLVDHVASMKPNIYVARVDGSAMYHRWYYEVVVDHIEMVNNLSPHLRVGWANTKGYLPYPGSGLYWGTNGVGDDFYSYGFDGQYLWTAGRPTLVRIPPTSTMTRQEVLNNQSVDYQNQQHSLLESYANQQNELVSNNTVPAHSYGTSDGLTSMSNIDVFTHSSYLRLQKNDVIGCMIDLSVPSIQFTINGKQIFGFFKNFNVTNGGIFHPVISFSARVSCRFLFGSNQGELRYRPPAGFSPIVEVLLPNQDVAVEPCFTFGDMAKQTYAGPQITPDCISNMVMDLIFIPRVIDTQNIEMSNNLEMLRDSLAENMHELWSMSRIEDGWIYGEEHDEQSLTHPYIAPFQMLPLLCKKYKLDLATKTLKTIIGLGYKITPSQSQDGSRRSNQAGLSNQRVKTYRLPSTPYMQSNGYKPAPLDLSNTELTPKLNHLVELLAENIHNIWAAEKISLKWTYKRKDPLNDLGEDFNDGRSCHLLPYKYVDDEIKSKNRQSAMETVFTIISYNHHIEPSLMRDNQITADQMTPAAQDTSDGTNLMAPSLSGAHSPGVGLSPKSPSRPVSANSGLIGAGGGGADTEPLTGHEVVLNNAREVGLRHYRAEKTYAVHSGRWYYEVEVGTVGHIQIGWANLNFPSDSPSLGCDENSWAYDSHTGRKVHASNYESFGQVACIGDVIGCMLDLNDRTISYSLNGKLMLDYLGNEMAFSSSDLPMLSGVAGGFVPAISLGVNQKVRLCFGQDVEQLRYFTDYGLQEGYHPFCVNMHKPITLWYNKREPNFINLDDLDPNNVNVEITRIPPGSDSPPALKVAYKQFESQERANWEYLRLSLPVTINAELIDEMDKIAKMQEIQAHQLRLAYSREGEYGKDARGNRGGLGDEAGGKLRHPARLEQHMLQSGFSMADIKDLQRSYENPEGGGSNKHGESNSLLNRSPLQRRQQLVKTRSVDDHGPKSSLNPSLAVPSFTEAQKMMMADKHSKNTLLKRRNTGFNLLRGSSTSLDNLNQADHQAEHDASDQPTMKTTRSKSTFKSIFGSMKSKATPGETRSRSLSRNFEGDDKGSRLNIPTISIQNQDQFGGGAGQLGPNSSLMRSRSMSRSGSYSSLAPQVEHNDSPSVPSKGGLVRRLSRVGLGTGLSSSKQAQQASEQTNPLQQTKNALQQSSEQEFEAPPFDLQRLDPATLEQIEEYYYGVRIFPGQEPSHVLCGWITSHFKHENLANLQDIQHTQIVQSTSLITGQAEICERRECYLLNAGQLYKELHPSTTAQGAAGDVTGTGASGTSGQTVGGESSSRSNRGMLIGCHVDTSTGVLSFTIDGKPTKYRVNVEPQTKLYPGIFFQATTGDCLQFELSRTALTLPLSSAILSLTPKHVNPQCPPRLKVQALQTCSWSRVPNVSLRPNSLKLSESRGWSMLADDPLAMLAVYIPEENRCLDVLELIEHEKLLRFHSNTLILYGALCAQGNHKVAHIICSYVDQRQLLYAINSDYLSGDLRRGFADLLIALHLEFHAYGRHLTQNEFIVPISKELCELYGEQDGRGSGSHNILTSSLVHSFSRIECVSIRTEMNMSPIGFDLSSIDNSPSGANLVKILSTPYFPINILKKLVFQALDEAVFKGNLPIRDLPGGSNENLFVPLLKLADRLLLIGCITNQELGWLLNLIDPETFERPKVEQGLDKTVDTPNLSGLSFLSSGSNSPSSVWKPTILEQPMLQGGARANMSGKGLLQMRKLDERVKLVICHILHHLLDIQLRHRIESIMAFSVNFVGHLQTDQRRRYDGIKTSNLPSHLTARKTREFRCTPREQMRYILDFKNNTDTDDLNSSPSSEALRNTLKNLHSSMMKQIKVIIESCENDDGGELNAGGDLKGDDYYARQRQQQFQAENTADGLSSSFNKLLRIIKLVKLTITTGGRGLDSHLQNQNGQFASIIGHSGYKELKFIKEIVKTVIKWAEECTIENKQLVRQMFHLLLRCYNGVGELIEALNNSYVIGEKSKQDVIDLLQVLSKVRALLAVQMGPAEEEVMRDSLWTLVNNVVFFQHPDLIRILRVHENVMHVMMNTLNKRSRAAQSSSASSGGLTTTTQEASGQPSTQRQRTQSIPGGAASQLPQQQQGSSKQEQGGQEEDQEDDISKMVVSCCRFLCFFCRSSAKNQKAMFEHLGFLLENSNILLSRPSLRGSTPLDVAYSSLMENHELVLALRESYLEKIAIYLSRCGLQSNQELLDKGYPDVGWDPIEGERYLDFLRFCVWVNGESVEENSNLVIRLLIRRPECLGPALRGEGPGLFAAIKDAIVMADTIHTEQLNEKRESQLESGITVEEIQQEGADEEEDEDQINMGSAILNFYCALVDLLGRCAPDLLTIGQGKHESIRARSILKSLVPLQDLKSAISLKFSLVNPLYAKIAEDELPFATAASTFMPNHKQSLVLFLERVYGIEDQETFFSLLEEAFLPDMRAATMLERCPLPSLVRSSPYEAAQGGFMDASGAGEQIESDDSPENEMTLALNRYLGNSAIPLLIRESHYFKNAENYANLLEPTLHTVYRLSKVKILTKGQREAVSDFLISLTREMQPHQLLKLLRKLTVDVAVLNESTTVALRLLTLHYERCSKYYGYTGSAQTSASGVFGTATEEERRLTMVLFTNIFDSLSLMDYDPELFENALPCLNALACALPPDYSLTESREFSASSSKQASGGARDVHAMEAAAAASQSVGPYMPQPVDTHSVELNSDLRRMAQRFSEHYHDAWASRKLDRDWTFGDQYNFKNRTHPRLKPYALLTRHERERYLEPIEEAMKALLAMGWTVNHSELDGSRGQAHRDQSPAGGLSRTPSRSDMGSVQYGGTSGGSSTPVTDPNQRREMIQNYNPQPVDTSNLSLSRELQNLAERSAENAHDLWAKKTMEDWEMKLRATAGDVLRSPIMLHPLMVPYDLLTDKEKRKNRDRSQELLKYMLFEGYKVYRPDDQLAASQQQQQSPQQYQRGRINSRAGTDSNYNTDMSRSSALSESSKRRFAYSILDKLLSYTDTVMVKLELLKPSANFSRRSSFKQSDRDVKFFSKVVLPLIERYFTAHREFFLTCGSATASNVGASQAQQLPQVPGPSASPSSQITGSAQADELMVMASIDPTTAAVGSSSTNLGMGFASIKEKEMLATLFTKFASILRNKLSVLGPDAKIFVRCLQVLTRALDARSLSEQSHDFIKTSMLTFFNKTAQDLSQCVFNLQSRRYDAVRGTTMRISGSLYHVHLGILPTLTALFDHLASSESGKYLLLDDIQIACQKILQSLYVLGTRIQMAGNHEFSRKELERHRHSYGNCLAAFAAAFPIAFLEPDLLRFNRFSYTNTRQQQPPLLSANLAIPASGKSKSARADLSEQQVASSSQAAASVPIVSADMQASSPSLEELMKLVSKFVQTGKGCNVGSSMPNSTAGSGSGSRPGGIYVAGSGPAGAQTQTTAGLQPRAASAANARQRGLAQASKMIPADNDVAIIEVIVPLLCSYLPFWYSQGPEASHSARTLGAGNGSTNVTFKHLNDLLKDIIHLIRRQVGIDDGNSGTSNWMVTIAAHASQIIIQSPETSLLAESFLPLSTKIAQRAESIYHREELMRGYLKSAAEDTTAIEEKIQEEFHVLVRDIYAFYPLLIKYVDFKKSTWLKAKTPPQPPAINSSAGNSKQTNSAPAADRLATLLDDSEINQQLEEQQNQPEQLLFQQVATVFDIWSNSQYFRREEQNFISQHEIDNMALIMQASNRPGRTFFQKTDTTQGSSAGRKKNKRRQGEKRDREREVASSLLVVALKRLLPIGMNLFEGRERELVQHVKERFLKKDSQARIEELVRLQLTQPYQVDPSDEFCWQHYLYSRLGGQNSLQSQRQINGADHYANGDTKESLALVRSDPMGQQQHFVVDSRIISRIVDMARVFYGLHIIDHPNLQQKTGRRSCVSTQRRRVVIACFRMTSLHSLPRHRAINIFLKSYCDTWLLDEDFGQEKLIEDLTQTFEQAEMKINGDESSIPRNDPLCQLIMTLSRQATTEHGSATGASGGGLGGQASESGVDKLYLQFADIFRMSCGGDEEDEDEVDETDSGNGGSDTGSGDSQSDEGSDQQEASSDDSGVVDNDESSKSEGASSSSIHEQEMEKQRLLFQQSRLSDRGVAEMILLYISAFSRYQAAAGGMTNASAGPAGGSGGAGAHNLSQHTPMILSTLKLGISILRGGNVEVQRRMLKHLKDKKDVGFFTSIQTLMNSCSVLDLDAFERNQKAEALGVRSEGAASEKNMYDAEFTCKLFRFFQLLCEGHNLEFQNYLRTQAGNTTTVNVVISTVDYLLRLQESIMDFYWHYSSKEIIDPSGTENFIKAITIAKQVFCTLTESIQGPCPMNQQALAHSRLWHAVGGFLFLFAHMQDKLSRNSSQLNLLIELLDLQKEMVIMMLSMLEGNVVNGTIGKQMVETLVESSGNVEIILKFFDMFLKLPRLTSSTNFQEYDKTGAGWISPENLRKAIEQHKIYTTEETQYLLSCCEPNHDGMIDYREFIDRFHQPAKDIGFNLAVLLTNLAEHITNEPRLQRFLETASTVLNYFEPYLGRIEIMGSSKRIERVYFEIKESTLDQWAKPQIQESKRAFFYSIVTEGDGKEKLEAFVNFCEDTIFEMQHASDILGEDEEEPPTKADKYPGIDTRAGTTSSGSHGSGDYMPLEGQSSMSRMAWLRLGYDGIIYLISLLVFCLGHLKPSKVRRRMAIIRSMTHGQLFMASVRTIFHLWFGATKFLFNGVGLVLKAIFKIMINDGGGIGRHLEDSTKAIPRKKPLEPLYPSPTIIEPAVSSSPTATVQTNSYSMTARTELITAPSVMTASVADVVSVSDASSIAETAKTAKEPAATEEQTLAGRQDGDQTYLGEIGLVDDVLIDGAPLATQKARKRRGLGFKLSQLTNYNQKIVSFLARNFYRIKLLALVTAFVINFILLFYKVSVWTDELEKDTSLASSAGFLSVNKDPSAADASDDGDHDTLIRSKLDSIEQKVRQSIAKYQGIAEEDDDDDEPDDDTDAADDNGDDNGDDDEDVVDTEDDPKEEGGDGVDDDDDDHEDGESTEVVEYVVMEEKYSYLQPILTFLATIHSLFSLCMLIAYYHLKVPLVIFKREKEIARKLEFEGLYITDEPDSDNWWNGHWDRLVISANSFPVNYWDKFVKKRVREKYREQYDYESLSALLGMEKRSSSSSSSAAAATANQQQGRLKSFLLGGGLLSGVWLKVDWRYQLWKAGVTLTDQSFQYQLLYLVFSLAGHFNAFFFAAHLLDVAVGFKKLQTILQSVTHNGKQLVLTVMLLTIVVYIYTVLAFNFFRKFYIQGDDQPDPKCHSMMTCFVYHLYQGVRAGGGIGDVIEAPDGDDYEVWRIIFDISFFFSVIIILLAIIQGLIIDAFGELRDQLLTVASDMESNCFICGIGKDVLDKVPRGFDTHVQKEHNLANYMFFLMHLINKPDTDYTGQETYVWELYQRRCWDFFPVGECFRTQSEEEADAKPSKD